MENENLKKENSLKGFAVPAFGPCLCEHSRRAHYDDGGPCEACACKAFRGSPFAMADNG